MSAPFAHDLLEKAREGDRQAAQTLVEANSGLIWSIARRYFGRGVDGEDLYQLGCLGLLKAIQSFDSGYGTQFSTYAVPKIAGEIRRFLRDDGAVKVSRSLKERSQTLRSARERLEQQLGREPLLSELSRETGLSPEEIAEAESASAATASLQQERIGGDGPSLEEILCDPEQESRMIEAVALREAIAALPERERAVIALRYFRGMTQEKAAGILRVSQVQVSRLERKAVERLRIFLE